MKPNQFRKFGVGAAAVAIAAAGGYAVRAETQPARAPAVAGAYPGAPTSFADIVAKVAPAVVSIEVEKRVSPVAYNGPNLFQFGLPDSDGEDSPDGLPFDLRRFFPQAPENGPAQPSRGAGSGFFISADGYVVTNNHVIDGADKITVHTADKRELAARVIGRDKATDLAVLKVEARDLPFVSFEERAKPRVGDWVVAVGNPFGLGGTATAGIVSALDRKNVSGSSYVDFLQIDAPINRGNSGGPTFDLYGRVVGVNTAIYSPSGGSVGIGFDIPADVAAAVTKQLIADGRVARGYIGATIQDVTPEIADSLGVAAKGALVADVAEGGPSASAGLKPGDLVLKIDGRDVEGAGDLTRQVGMVRSGQTLRLDIRREGRPMQIAVRSGARPDEPLAANDARPPAGARSEGSAVLGMTLDRNDNGRGVRVAGVARSSPAAERGLKAGDVILRAGEQAAASPKDVADVVAEAKAKGRKQVLLLVARGKVQTFVPVEVGQG